jgi:hypothetical protein
MRKLFLLAGAGACIAVAFIFGLRNSTDASSHREAPIISADPLADNTDLYAFRNPYDTNMITIVADYIPLELPEGGPNYETFGQGVQYDIHIKNQTYVGSLGSAYDDIRYQFDFLRTDEDSTTFFNIRLGKQNLKTIFKCTKITDVNGAITTTQIATGPVPPNNIGPRSIESGVGLNTSYGALVSSSIVTASSGEKIFCGPRDDPFFVDLGGVFDLGQTRSTYGTDPSNPANARDALAGFNTHAIVLNIPISNLQKDGKTVDQAANILDPNFVIGVWASASRRQIRTLSITPGGATSNTGPFVQISRLGMPLTNEVIIPVGQKDYWNAVSPYGVEEQEFVPYFANPELALYMDSTQYAAAIPSLAALQIQSQSYPAIGVIPGYATPGFNFHNFHDGAWAVTKLASPPNLSGTAFAAGVQPSLVDSGKPRLVDIYPIFYFGVPNLIPYQLATGKDGGPLDTGKAFINNFLPITLDAGKLYGGDMLRLNMATPVTPRGTPEYNQYARMGLIRAAVLGLTAAPYNTSKNLEAIPHMDGFPNGRRLEDDVTTIELQAVGGLVLAAVGLPFNDAVAGDYSDLASGALVGHLLYNAGPTQNDVPFLSTFPYLADPHRGWDYVKQLTASAPAGPTSVGSDFMGMSVPKAFFIDQNYPNPFNPSTTIKYHLSGTDQVTLKVFNAAGQEVATLVDARQNAGTYSVNWDAAVSGGNGKAGVASGVYFYRLQVGNTILPAKKAMLIK